MSYVGQTTKTLDQRWTEHVYDAIGKRSKDKGCYFHLAIKKYGPDKFCREVLEVCLDKDSLNLLEMHYISTINTVRPNGYNIALGGTGVMHGRKMSEETKAKISKSLIGRPGAKFKHTNEAKAKISASLIGNTRSVGRKHSKETKKKISEAHKGKVLSEETRSKIPGRPRSICTHEKSAENTFPSGGCRLCARDRLNKRQ